MSRTQREGRSGTQRLRRRCLAAMAILIGATTLSGCQKALDAIEDLTKPDTPSAARSITLKVTPDNLPEGGGEVTLAATVRAGEVSEAGIPVKFHASSGSFPNGSEANTDAEGVARVALVITESVEVKASLEAAGVTVTETAATRIVAGQDDGGGVTKGSVKFEIETTPKPAVSGSPVKIDITASDTTDGSWASGRLEIEFGDGKKANIADFSRRAVIQHTYKDPSSFPLTVKLTDDAGRESTRTMSLRVDDGSLTDVVFEAATAEWFAKEELEFTVKLTRDDARSGRGNVTIDWGDGKRDRLGDVTGTKKVMHDYRAKGNYKAVATVTTESGKTETASYRIRINAPITLDASIDGDRSPTTGSSASFAFRVERSDNQRPTGDLQVQFGDGAEKFFNVTSSVTSFSHVYTADGTYQISATYTDDDGRTARATTSVTASTSNDGGGGGGGGDDGGGGGGGGGGADQINAGSITYLHANVSGWAVTSTTTSVSVTPGEICVNHTKAGKWPVNRAVEGNPWIVANIGGRWYAATWEWLRPGQTCKRIGVPAEHPTTAQSIGPHTKKSPLSSWVPKKGETVYFFMSTHARDGTRTRNERSNMVKVVWPY
ncbi:MAG: hypothetical protein GKS06_02960 [Acidobacteria bacterium]|nr:hypothetical protein [Acidobacteriota bacterium]